MKKILNVVFILIVIGISIYYVYYQFTHPKLTQTELFFDLWKQELAALVAVIGYLISSEND